MEMNRIYNNCIAVLITMLLLGLILSALLGGCAYYSISKTGQETKAKALTWRDSEAPYIEVVVEDGEITKFVFSADSIDNPAPGDLGDVGSLLTNMNAYCKAYPVACAGSRDAPEYTPEIIRRAEVYCRAYPAQCDD
jgi:hypothetical protein